MMVAACVWIAAAPVGYTIDSACQATVPEAALGGAAQAEAEAAVPGGAAQAAPLSTRGAVARTGLDCAIQYVPFARRITIQYFV